MREAAVSDTVRDSHSPGKLMGWLIGYGTFGVPQAAAPIAFGLLALPLTGTAESGAALVFAMTTALVVGAVPVSRLGTRFNAVLYLRLLLAFRTLALALLVVLAYVGAPFWALMTAVVAAGSVTGAAYGYQRLILNYLIQPSQLPRALGLAATLNEITFALAPVLASLLGSVSPLWAMVIVTVLGAGPMVSIPWIADAREVERPPSGASRQRVPGEAYLWLFCALAGSGAVAAVEVGAVAFALAYGLGPGWAFLFALVLCIGSVIGGIYVSVRNRMPPVRQVALFLAATTAASSLILLEGHLALTLTGAVLVGFFMPQLLTFYSLKLDELAPPDRRAEMFSLLRTATSMGVIVISGLLALSGLRAALIGSVALVLVATCLAAVHASRDRGE